MVAFERITRRHSKKSERGSYQLYQATSTALKFVLPHNEVKADLGMCHLR